MIHPVRRSNIVQVKKNLPVQSVVGFPISTLSFDGQVDAMMTWAVNRQSKAVCVSNVHMLMEGYWCTDFAKVLGEADMLTPDGMPLVWVMGLMSGRSYDRVAGLELMLALCERAQKSRVGVFLLGSTDEMLAEIQRRLRRDFSDLRVVGVVSPPFRQMSSEEKSAIARQINRSGAGLVFVSLGCPKQERWMNAHQGKVNAVMVGLGGAFGVYAGEQRWAPAWVRNCGLEWLYRLKQEPKRLWKRYASTIPPFLWLAFKQVVKARLGSNSN